MSRAPQIYTGTCVRSGAKRVGSGEFESSKAEPGLAGSVCDVSTALRLLTRFLLLHRKPSVSSLPWPPGEPWAAGREPCPPRGSSAAPCRAPSQPTRLPGGSKGWQSACTGAAFWGGGEALLSVVFPLAFGVAQCTQAILTDFHNNAKVKMGEPGHPKIYKSMLK